MFTPGFRNVQKAASARRPSPRAERSGLGRDGAEGREAHSQRGSWEAGAAEHVLPVAPQPVGSVSAIGRKTAIKTSNLTHTVRMHAHTHTPTHTIFKYVELKTIKH